MYLILGGEDTIPEEEVIGIFDLDNISWAHRTREYLAESERQGRIVNVTDGLPRTLVVTKDKDYLLQFSSQKAATRRI